MSNLSRTIPGSRCTSSTVRATGDRYRELGIDRRFAETLDRVRPDIVHAKHLDRLSTSLPAETAARAIPVVHTLHDYWLMCPRGQFIQTFSQHPDDPWAVCDSQQDRKCAKRCCVRYFGGDPEECEADVACRSGGCSSWR